MTINPLKTVGAIATEIPSAARVFEKLGIDYCCGGNKSLEEACSATSLSVEAALHGLQEAEGSSHEEGRESRNWYTEPLSSLVSHIVNKHHHFTREELVRLEQWLPKVCAMHADKHPELLHIQSLLPALHQELMAHMFKEEQLLFPYIIRMEEAVNHKEPIPRPMFRTVQNPVRMMMLEHDSTNDTLREIHEARCNYGLPPDACASYQPLYQALEAFEQDLHQHIYLENYILFPRAVNMEGAAWCLRRALRWSHQVAIRP